VTFSLALLAGMSATITNFRYYNNGAVEALAQRGLRLAAHALDLQHADLVTERLAGPDDVAPDFGPGALADPAVRFL